MNKLIFITVLAAAVATSAPRQAQAGQQAGASEVARWEREAANVTIVRDDWGIAHVYGKTDADAVFGMEYAQAEDDFNRVETNYINAMGRLSEAEGESQIWRDLRMKLFIDPAVMKAKYAASPAWLKQLMNAFADGLNFYLYKHPAVHPRVITHFEPWMALAFTEGSIGGDIESGVNLDQLAAFYGGVPPPPARARGDGPPPEPTGSNGIAIAPAITLDHHALLWINPHTSFYFRSELQMASDQGLDAYGAVTWGQFFIYQGFNRTAGWMHTSSGVDNIDEFLETVTKQDGRYYYKYGDKELPVKVRTITVPYRTATGMAHRTFTAYYTQHGPIIGKIGDKWVSISLMQRPVRALIQDFTRTKAKDYAAFRRIMHLHTNSSNNTIFADAEGNIAYFHSNYIPRRDPAFDWTKPVDGSNPATAYHGLLTIDETPHLLNPPNGWLYNSNNWPWSAAGPYSPKRQDFPKYVERGTEESPRGYHALRILPGHTHWTMSSLTAAAFDSYLPAFSTLIPPLLRAYDGIPASNPLKAKLARQIVVLRRWNFRWGIDSVATSLAVFWGTDIYHRVGPDARAAGMSPEDYVEKRATPAELLQSLAAASDRLAADFGTWQTPWGDINRFQRLNDDIEPNFDDAKPSIPVPFTSSLWGSLASFGARAYPNTKKWYGTSGNSFVAVVEFGPRVRARAVTAGGESGHPGSPHFDDEAERYATGNLRVVYFYRSQLEGHTERTYHPGS
ncbi:MAG TPA: penicillin acylase family protein [Vicinamibacterales bacterium]|nr:penicillin acylase family protein [Vicinamibacterales bacterium]